MHTHLLNSGVVFNAVVDRTGVVFNAVVDRRLKAPQSPLISASVEAMSVNPDYKISIPVDSIRGHIVAVYRACNPSMVGNADKIMERYRGAELYAYHLLCQKYSVPPVLPVPADLSDWVDEPHYVQPVTKICSDGNAGSDAWYVEPIETALATSDSDDNDSEYRFSKLPEKPPDDDDGGPKPCSFPKCINKMAWKCSAHMCAEHCKDFCYVA